MHHYPMKGKSVLKRLATVTISNFELHVLNLRVNAEKLLWIQSSPISTSVAVYI
jgi:hypothetical protein